MPETEPADDHVPGGPVVATPETPHGRAAFCLRLFGSFELRCHGELLPPLRSRGGKSLLALLALRCGQPVERAWLAGTLWPESSGPLSHRSLRSSLVKVRRWLGGHAVRLVSPTPRTLGLDLTDAEVDVLAFDVAIARGDSHSLAEAVDLHRGPLLEGCNQLWVFQERRAREQAYLAALERLASLALAEDDLGAAERHLRRAIAADPLRETAPRALMQILAAGGNYAAALQVYRELRLLLHRELNAEPDAETQALFAQIRSDARRRTEKVITRRERVAGAATSGTPAPERLPEGTVAFLFADVEGGGRRWEGEPGAMRAVLGRLRQVLSTAVRQHAGRIFQLAGDQLRAAFPTTPKALAAAVAAQQALHREVWGGTGPVRVRIALHAGSVEERRGDYSGPALNRLSRLLQTGHGGQILLSLAAQELVCDLLPEGISLRDLGRHRLSDLSRPEQIFQVRAPDLPDEFPPLDTLDLRPQNLPAQTTPLIGREQELARARVLAQRDAVRLITFTGPGGIGKTRFALQLAAELLEGHPDGAFFIDLASITDPQRVIAAIAQGLDVRETADQTLKDKLRAHLRQRHLVLLLDNFEQVLPAATMVADLLTAAARLKILVTSREPLRLRAEHQFPVPPLQLPDPSDGLSPESLSQHTAASLFIERALAVKPDFVVTDTNAPAVAEICRRLEGIPLAIELAAARIKLFSPEVLLEGLSSRLTLLVDGPRDLPSRQQTLRDAIAWSYHLLDDADRALFRRLSLFAGGCTAEAAEAVCRLDDFPALEIPERLASLADKSLLRIEETEEEPPRFVMLETIREFGRQCLTESGETGRLQHRHVAFFTRWAEETIPASQSGPDREWLARCRREHENLRAALAWTLEQGNLPEEPEVAELGLRLVGALAEFWEADGYWAEGRTWLERVLALPGAIARTPARARSLYGLGHLLARVEEHDQAEAHCAESVAIWRELAEPIELARCLLRLGAMHSLRDRFDSARTLVEEAMQLYQRLQDSEGANSALHVLGGLAYRRGDLDEANRLWEECAARWRASGQRHRSPLGNLSLIARYRGEYEKARRLLDESLEIHRAMHQKPGIVGALNNLGDLACWQGDLRAAADYWEEALPLSRTSDHPPTKADPLIGLGRLARLRGELDQARAFFEESLAIATELTQESVARGSLIARIWNGLAQVEYDRGNLTAARAAYRESISCWQEWVWPETLPRFGPKVWMTGCLDGLAIIAAKEAQYARAVQFFAASAAYRDALGAGWPQPELMENQRWLAHVREHLGEEAFAAAWERGRAMTLEQSVAEALKER